MSTKKLTVAGVLILLTLSTFLSWIQATYAQQNNTSFTFAFGGDTGYYGNDLAPSIASHQLISADFFINLGDISYNGTSRSYPPTGNEGDWCNFVKQNVHNRLGQPNYPYEIVAGNHEDGTDPQMDGYIDNFIGCLPNQFSNFIGSGLFPCGLNCYGKEGYFDYPLNHPIARFIMIANALKINPGPANSSYIYDYCPLSACGGSNPSPAEKIFDQHYQWLKQTIEGAKAAGYWVIVIHHKPCLVPDNVTFCEGEGTYNGQSPGAQLLSLEISERVDLVINGHAHIYARSKQLTCYGPVQPNDGIFPAYQPSCVANDGSKGTYMKAAGIVQIIQGDFSQRDGLLNFTRPDINYFATAMTANGPSAADCCWVNGNPIDDNSGNGIGVITVTPQTLSYTRQMSGPPSHTQGTTGIVFSDSFKIESSNQGSANCGLWLPVMACGIDVILVYGIFATIATLIPVTYLVVRRMRRKRVQHENPRVLSLDKLVTRDEGCSLWF